MELSKESEVIFHNIKKLLMVPCLLTVGMGFAHGKSVQGCQPPAPLAVTKTESAIWGDFKTAEYLLIYDIPNRTVRAQTTLVVATAETGFPIFDLREEPSEVKLDGKLVGQSPLKLPGSNSLVRRLHQVVPAGIHKIEIWSEIQDDVRFGSESVESRFRFFDLLDRSFLEKYLPTNLEFDPYAMTLQIRILGGKSDSHEVFSNGLQRKTADGFEIEFPKHFTASSPFFHLTPKGRYKKLRFQYASLSGRNIPVTIYTKRGWFDLPILASIFKKRLEGLWGYGGILPGFEKRFGSWPHDGLLIYGHNRLFGGMEYPGATESSHFPFRHEVLHNYFGRSVMPCNGSAGWIDEAIASWNDFQRVHDLFVKLGIFSLEENGILERGDAYGRATPRGAYRQGRHFISEVQRQLTFSKSSPKTFDQSLRAFHRNHALSQISDEQFLSELNTFAEFDFQPVANTYIYRPRGPAAVFPEGEN